MIGIIGLIVAIAVLIVGAYKGLGALPLTIIAALVAIFTNQMPVWESLAQTYIGGYIGTYSGYFLIFVFSALYAQFMQETGSATMIGYKFIDWFGRKNAILISFLVTIVLSYGGVSLFVVVFAVGPIYYLLFKEANLPRHLIIGCLTGGSATLTMTSLPGTPALTNVIPTEFLGTTMTAAPILGILCSIGLFVGVVAYMSYAQKKAVAAGEGWTNPPNYDPKLLEGQNRNTLPAAWKAFLPMVVLLLFIIIGSRYIADSAKLTVIAMLIGCALCILLNLNQLKGKNIALILTTGMGGGITGIGGLAAVVAFGTVVQNTAAFQEVVAWVLSFDMHPYFQGIFSTAVIAGITGSSSGGLRIALQSLGEHFLASGVNMSILHRLMAIAAGSLDSLPHSSGLFVMIGYLGLTHKECYKHVFWTTVVLPAVIVVIAAIACVLLGL